MDKETFADYAVKNAIEETLQEALAILDADDGKTFEEKKEALIKHLEKHREPILADTLADCAIADTIGQQIKDSFWNFGEITCSDPSIILSKVSDADRAGYMEIQKEYSTMKSMLKEQIYCDMLWNELVQPKALMLTISKDGNYVGYCGIRNTAEKPWEIAIELLPQWTQKGIGAIAISGMLDAIKTRLDISEFRARIDPSNHSSQKLFEKLGAKPNGISEYLIHNQAKLDQCEEDNLHLIDESLINLAAKFNVEPRRLLSHVLEYAMTWNESDS